MALVSRFALAGSAVSLAALAVLTVACGGDAEADLFSSDGGGSAGGGASGGSIGGAAGNGGGAAGAGSGGKGGAAGAGPSGGAGGLAGGGTAGSSGNGGASGGASGHAGASAGDAGASGKAGAGGFAGKAGGSAGSGGGAAGKAGSAGAAGGSGKSGSAGSAGTSGKAGSAGASGAAGAGGTAGVAGSAGSAGAPPCGNGTIDANEKCDGTELGGATCASVLGTGITGDLACSPTCTFDTAACSTCGNGVIDAGEQCEDGPDVAGGRCKKCLIQCPDGGKAFGGHCYSVHKGFTDWEEARDECVKRGAHLVSITSAEENDGVIAILGGKQQFNLASYWLGLDDRAVEGTFVWLTGEPLGFTAWDGNEPNSAFGGEDCAALAISDGTWSDAGCGVGRSYVCEIDEPLKK